MKEAKKVLSANGVTDKVVVAGICEKLVGDSGMVEGDLRRVETEILKLKYMSR